MSGTIDEVLSTIDRAQESMTRQVGKMNEILEKSNGILLHIEACKPKSTSTAAVDRNDNTLNNYSIQHESEHALHKIVIEFQMLLQHLESKSTIRPSNTCIAADGVMFNHQRIEYLASGVRKLLAISQTVRQLKQCLQQQNQSAANLIDGQDDDDREN